MKTTTAEVNIKTAFGTELPKELQLLGLKTKPFTEYETENEIPAGERLTSDQYTAAVNARTKAKMKAQTTTDALDDAAKAYATAHPGTKVNPYEKPDVNSEDVMRANMLKTLMKLHKGMSEEVALQILNAATQAAVAATA